jgi:hypothetical protein
MSFNKMFNNLTGKYLLEKEGCFLCPDMIELTSDFSKVGLFSKDVAFQNLKADTDFILHPAVNFTNEFLTLESM